MLGNAAFKNPSYILIDEPELNLHPRLQRDFLTALGSYAQDGVLFATHNIGLARASAQAIYTVSIDRDKGDIRVVKPLDELHSLSEFLGELGSSYRELGFDKILLVEGPTEVTTIQQFLRLYGKDHQILLVPLGGGSLINGSPTTEGALMELTRITADIHILIDSERTSKGGALPKNTQDFVYLCKKKDIGIPCHVLERRAIENYFTDAAVKTIKGHKYSALAPYDSLKSASPAWAKSENWKIAQAMTKADLSATDLGEFLERL